MRGSQPLSRDEGLKRDVFQVLSIAGPTNQEGDARLCHKARVAAHLGMDDGFVSNHSVANRWRWFSRLPAERAVTLAIVAFVAMAFTVGALLMVGGAAASALTTTHGKGVIRSCVGEDTRGGGSCLVDVTAPATLAGPAQVDPAGPFAQPQPGQSVSLWIHDDGSVEVAGWRAWADAVSLALVAAVVVTVCWVMYRNAREVAAAPPS